MRNGFCAALGLSIIVLSACQGPGTPATAAAAAKSVTSLPQPEVRPHSSASLCTKDEVPVLSCAIKKTRKLASLCAVRSDELWKFRFVYGTPGELPDAVSPSHGFDNGRSFNRSRLMLFDGAGGVVYSTVSDGQRYALYSIQGKGFARAGLQISPPAAETVTSDEECLHETLIESENDNLIDAVDRWDSDPSFQDKNLPSVSR